MSDGAWKFFTYTVNLPEYESNHIDHFVFIGCTGVVLQTTTHQKGDDYNDVSIIAFSIS